MKVADFINKLLLSYASSKSVPDAYKGFFSANPMPAGLIVPPPPVVSEPSKSSKFDEDAFRKWYSYWSSKTGIDPDPDHPLHKYDYRAAFLANAQPVKSSDDGLYHWPSEFKAWNHPNRFVGGIDTITGKRVVR